jgi:hypothetical protein
MAANGAAVTVSCLLVEVFWQIHANTAAAPVGGESLFLSAEPQLTGFHRGVYVAGIKLRGVGANVRVAPTPYVDLTTCHTKKSESFLAESTSPSHRHYRSYEGANPHALGCTVVVCLLGPCVGKATEVGDLFSHTFRGKLWAFALF